MSTDELWTLFEDVTTNLATRLIARKNMLEERMKQLSSVRFETLPEKAGRRSYPKVLPKFRNQDEPSQTWTGRGRQPRWLTTQLRAGKRMEDFRIEQQAQ
jgi:DNA-binding protein H-NS